MRSFNAIPNIVYDPLRGSVSAVRILKFYVVSGNSKFENMSEFTVLNVPNIVKFTKGHFTKVYSI